MLKIVIKSQGREQRKGQKKTTKVTREQLKNGSSYIPIHNYSKCKWIKCSHKRHRMAEWI